LRAGRRAWTASITHVYGAGLPERMIQHRLQPPTPRRKVRASDPLIGFPTMRVAAEKRMDTRRTAQAVAILRPGRATTRTPLFGATLYDAWAAATRCLRSNGCGSRRPPAPTQSVLRTSLGRGRGSRRALSLGAHVQQAHHAPRFALCAKLTSAVHVGEPIRGSR
jgi:hypothetical protein